MLQYFQIPLSSNPKTSRYMYLSKLDDEADFKMLNPTNRGFFVKFGVSSWTVKSTGLGTIKYATVKKRLGDKLENNDDINFANIIRIQPVAGKIIKAQSDKLTWWMLTRQQYRKGVKKVVNKPRDLKTIKITGIPEDVPMKLVNNDLHDLSHRQVEKLLSELDMKVYLDLVENAFLSQWQNKC